MFYEITTAVLLATVVVLYTMYTRVNRAFKGATRKVIDEIADKIQEDAEGREILKRLGDTELISRKLDEISDRLDWLHSEAIIVRDDMIRLRDSGDPNVLEIFALTRAATFRARRYELAVGAFTQLSEFMKSKNDLVIPEIMYVRTPTGEIETRLFDWDTLLDLEIEKLG